MTTPIADIPASSIPAARAWILTGLQAQFATEQNLLVFFDEPAKYQPDDMICVGEVQQTYTPDQTVGSGGRFWLREDYTITVTVSSFRGGNDPAAVFLRARQLADVVVALVRSDPSLGGVVDRAMPATASHKTDWHEDGSGLICDVVLGITVMNVI